MDELKKFDWTRKYDPPKDRREHRLDMGSYYVDIDLDAPWPKLCRSCHKLGVAPAEGSMALSRCPHCGALN